MFTVALLLSRGHYQQFVPLILKQLKSLVAAQESWSHVFVVELGEVGQVVPAGRQGERASHPVSPNAVLIVEKEGNLYSQVLPVLLVSQPLQEDCLISET